MSESKIVESRRGDFGDPKKAARDELRQRLWEMVSPRVEAAGSSRVATATYSAIP